MNDDRSLLQIEAFTQQIGRDEKIHTLRRFDVTTISRCELRKNHVSRYTSARDPGAARREGRDAGTCDKPASQRVDSLGVVAERDDALASMYFEEARQQCCAFFIGIRSSSTTLEECVDGCDM